jgi:hypothetical protein
VRSSQLKGLFGIQCGVNSTENYVRSLAPRHFVNLVTAQRARGMNANPDRIARVNRGRIYLRKVSSTKTGSPKLLGVVAASTYCQHGLLTAVPNDTLLGLIS